MARAGLESEWPGACIMSARGEMTGRRSLRTGEITRIFSLGGERFARKVRGTVRLCRETPGQKELARRRSFEEIVKIVERLKGEAWLVFRDRHGDWGRDAVLWAGRK